jgi:hypothetical protein
LIRQAGEAFQDYLKSLGGKKYAGASQALEPLESALQDFAAQAGKIESGVEKQKRRPPCRLYPDSLLTAKLV